LAIGKSEEPFSWNVAKGDPLLLGNPAISMFAPPPAPPDDSIKTPGEALRTSAGEVMPACLSCSCETETTEKDASSFFKPPAVADPVTTTSLSVVEIGVVDVAVVEAGASPPAVCWALGD
jgi:hypothetical protein